jgi:hypothetical protein
MINNKEIFFTYLVAGCLAAPVCGQPMLLGGAGTSSADGWKFHASYFIEPKLLPGQHLSIAGQTDVIHTEAENGKPVTFHRYFTDPEAKTFWGYDVEVEPTEKAGSAVLRFKPFSLHGDQLEKKYHTADFVALPAPQFPVETFRSGQTIAVDMLKNPSTGQTVVDYVEVSYSPIRIPSKAEPRDFQVADVILHITAPTLRLNNAAVPQAIVADQVILRKLVWLSVPGHGRFLLSLAPYANYAFQKAGVVTGFGLSFSWNGERYEWRSRESITESSGNWNLYVLAAPSASGGTGQQGFSFGGVNSVEEFLAKAQ